MLDLNYFMSLNSYIDVLSSTDKPIFIYGMGDGCLKVMAIFERYNIPCAGIFASDEFVRDKVFCGHRIHRLSEIEDCVDDFIAVLAFGAGYAELIDKLDRLSQKHTLIVPDMPVIGEGLFTKEYLRDNFDRICKVYSLLADEKSRLVYKNVLEFKITGDIRLLKECESTPDEAYSNILKLRDNEIYVDLGAYTGDTLDEFLRHTDSHYRAVYAVEPNKRNFRKLTEYIGELENITAVNAASWSQDTTLVFSKGGGRMPHLSENGVETPAVSVDSLLNGRECTYIKMDVEGAEEKAILGAEKTICSYSPKLNVALYHRVGDIFELPEMLYSINSRYKLYVRHFPYYPAWDTNLYAIADGV